MPEFLHTVLKQDTTLAASTVYDWDIGVNPISVLLFTLLFQNNTGTIGDYTAISAALAQIAKIEIQYKGQAIISGNGADLALMFKLLTRKQLSQVNQVNTDDQHRSLTLPIVFSRRLFDPEVCFPATRKGELVFHLEVAAAQTGIDTLKAQLEQVELPEASPTRFLKYTTMTKTPSATGEHDVDLPLGNQIMGILLWGTTPPTGTYAAKAPSLGWVKLLVDNVEKFFSKSNFDTLHNMMVGLSMMQDQYYNVHGHWSPSAAADADTDDLEFYANDPDAYAYMDFDPLMDGQYMLQTEGAGRVNLRINAETADAIRVIPVEIMQVGA